MSSRQGLCRTGVVVLDPTLDCLLIDAVSLIRSSCSLYLPVSQRKQRMITPKTGLFGSLELKFLPLPRPLFLCSNRKDAWGKCVCCAGNCIKYPQFPRLRVFFPSSSLFSFLLFSFGGGIKPSGANTLRPCHTPRPQDSLSLSTLCMSVFVKMVSN